MVCVMLDTVQINLNNRGFVSFFSLKLFIIIALKNDTYLLEKQQQCRIPYALVTKPSF